MKAILLLSSLVLALIQLADAQQPPKVPQIGFISVSGNAKNPGLLVEAFRQGLRELGYIDRKNIIVEYRYAAAEPERVPEFVAELIQLKAVSYTHLTLPTSD